MASEKTLFAEDYKKISENLEKLLRENEQIENRDKFLNQLFGQSSKRNEIRALLYKNNINYFEFLGKILINFSTNDEKIIDKIVNKEFFQKKELYYMIEEESEYQRFINFIENLQNNLTQDIENIWENKVEEILNLKMRIKPKIKIEKYKDLLKVFNIEDQILKDIVTGEFLDKCKILFDSKLDDYKNNRYENAIFLNRLTEIFINRKDLDEVLNITASKLGDFKILYNLCQKFPEKKEEYLKMRWNDLRKEAKR